jgi:cytochrome c6
MKTISPVLALTLISFASATMAADAEKGKEVFADNCSTCHSGGKNAMALGKSLSKQDLVTSKMDSAAAIIELVTNGRSPMPAFGKSGTINTADIENVAAYVLKKAHSGW